MHIYDEILERLRNEYEKGATYKEIAKEKNISYSYLRGIINGEYPTLSAIFTLKSRFLKTFLSCLPVCHPVCHF